MATTEDVRRVALAVQHARTREDKVVHQVNQMLTVIKENHDELNETRERVNIVITTLQKYTKALLELTSDTRSMAKNLSEIRKVLMFEQALAQIEVGVNQYKQQLALYRRQHNQLADEKLTPDLLTRTDLMKILNQHRRLPLYLSLRLSGIMSLVQYQPSGQEKMLFITFIFHYSKRLDIKCIY